MYLHKRELKQIILDNVNSHSGSAEKFELEVNLCGPFNSVCPFTFMSPLASMWPVYTYIGPLWRPFPSVRPSPVGEGGWECFVPALCTSAIALVSVISIRQWLGILAFTFYFFVFLCNYHSYSAIFQLFSYDISVAPNGP